MTFNMAQNSMQKSEEFSDLVQDCFINWEGQQIL